MIPLRLLKKIGLNISLLIILNTLYAQRYLSKEEMRADILQLKDEVNSVFKLDNGSPEVDIEIQQVFKMLPDSLEAFYFYPYCLKVLSSFSEGHLHLQGDKKDPFFLNKMSNLLHDTLVYNTNVKDSVLFYLGSSDTLEVNGYNDVDIKELSRFASSLYKGEGSCSERGVNQLVEQFSYVTKWYNINSVDSVNCFVLSDSTSLCSKGVSLEELKYWYSTKPVDTIELMSYSFNEKNETAYLSVSSFNPAKFKSRKLSYKKSLRKVFGHMAENNVAHLILDLRENSGGVNYYADLLLSYLVDLGKKDSLYVLNVKDRLHVVKPYKTRFDFDGRIYVLISEDTYSNASRIASQLRRFNGVELYGACASGKAQNMWAGKYKEVELENSGFQLHIPYYQYYYYDYPSLVNDCLCPDVYLVNDFRTSQDEVLKGVVDIILKNIRP